MISGIQIHRPSQALHYPYKSASEYSGLLKRFDTPSALVPKSPGPILCCAFLLTLPYGNSLPCPLCDIFSMLPPTCYTSELLKSGPKPLVYKGAIRQCSSVRDREVVFVVLSCWIAAWATKCCSRARWPSPVSFSFSFASPFLLGIQQSPDPSSHLHLIRPPLFLSPSQSP